MRLYDKLGYVINLYYVKKNPKLFRHKELEPQPLILTQWKWSLHVPKKRSKNSSFKFAQN